ncbi:MAG: GGDEF domain-containing protein [Deltaproteobacteria bacterium]|nr:GGDEF domain-containing protein [Deltaproteobacteria bacterium]
MKTHPPIFRCLIPMMIGLAFLAAAAAPAAAQMPVLSITPANPTVQIAAHAEVFLDDSGTLRYEDIARGGLPFQRHTQNSFQYSFTRATLWIKCRIATAAHHSFLVFDNTALGSITIWVPVVQNGSPGLIVLSGGWQSDQREYQYPFLYPTFVLPDTIDDSRPVVIRVATPYALQFRATLYSGDAFRENGFILFLIVGFCAGILVAMLLYNLILYIFIRDKNYLYYVLYVFFLLLWQCVLFGLIQYFWPQAGEWMIKYITAFASCMMLFAAIFAMVFLDTAKTAPRHHLVLEGLALMAVISILLIFTGQIWIGNVLAYFTGQIGIIAIFTAAVAALRSGFQPAIYYLSAVSVFLLAALIFQFRFYGLISNNSFTMHVVLFGSAVESVLLSSALGYRFRAMREEEQHLREREKNLQAITVTDELTGLFNRRFLNGTLIKEIAAAKRSGRSLSLLMMDVDHFKAFNDAHGHLEGDQALITLGKVLRQMLREEDIACRYGGEEFVAILHNADKNAALDVAERIRSHFQQMALSSGKTVRLTVSIGATELLPQDSPDQFLFRADQALYHAKKTGRNRVCSV